MKRFRTAFKLTFSLLSLLALSACEEQSDLSYTTGKPPLVIEGWIEEEDYPIVIVTRALDLNDEQARLDDAIEKWCRVTVFDDGDPYVLTARKSDAYKPGFIFTSNRIKGKTGHTYRLLVETDDTVASAEATLLRCASITRLEAFPANDIDSLYSLRAYLDNVSDESYYKFFCKSDKERRHFPCFLGNVSGKQYDDNAGVAVTRGIHGAFMEPESEFSHFFAPGETVEVKICSLDRQVFDFWTTYDLNVSLSSNIFLTFASDCLGNITGAKGYWAAYGSSLKVCRIPMETDVKPQ